MSLSSLSYEVRRPPRWNTFAAGIAINVAGVVALVVAGPHLTSWIPQEKIVNIRSVTLIAPLTTPASEPQPRRIPVPPVIAKVERPKIVSPAAPSPRPEPARIEPPKVAVAQREAPKIAASAPLIPPKPVAPKEIKTNVFTTGQSQAATVKEPAQKVQTGGFGDPNGIAGQGDSKRDTVTVAKLGSFDLPTGGGKGNGTGGSSGVSGTVRSSGFGVSVASRAPRERSYGGGIAEGGFGTPVAASGAAPRPAEKKPDLQPVEILYKPRPDYTAEARRMRVEGEVLLDIVFSADGSLHISRVVRGLGYGLDDTARAAALRIKFRPARRDGQPYDCAALVHMVFELAK